MLEGLDLTAPDILLSGAAEGADSAFSKMASASKHQVVNWTFAGHKTKLRKGLYQLSTEHLAAADPYLARANKNLLRSWPPQSQHVNNLLRRNFYQVKWSNSVYAVSRWSKDKSMLRIDGGTAWACQMYVDRFLYDQEPMSLCNLYFFDQDGENWYTWNRVWEQIPSPPKPQGIYAGIGSRDLNAAGTAAICCLYD